MAAMLKFIMENFAHVFPIIASGGIGLVIMIERALALSVTYPVSGYENFFERVRILVMKDRVPDAIALCDSMRSKPVARVVRAGLSRSDQPEHLIEHGLQIAVSEATDKINTRTAFLGTIANVATLFGLLGTIIGLVQSFEAVGAASAQARSAMLANGISTAMNATMLGLGVAIPCMIAYSWLNSRAAKQITLVDQSAVRTLDLLQQRYYHVTQHDPSQEPTFQNVITPRKRA